MLTNKTNIPRAIFAALSNDPYDSAGSDITASTIADPPLLQALKRQYPDSLEEDAAERLWSLLGQACHVVAERAAGNVDGVVSEKRYFTEVLGWKISGAVDHLDGGTLSDMKVTSAFTIIYGDRVESWSQQLNVLAYLVEENGGMVSALEIIAVLRDFAQREVTRIKNYPMSPIVVIPLKLWTKERQKSFIEERVRMHQAARKLAEAGLENQIEPCSDEERWMKRDKKTGEKTFQRCEKYCAASMVCPVLKREKEIAA